MVRRLSGWVALSLCVCVGCGRAPDPVVTGANPSPVEENAGSALQPVPTEPVLPVTLADDGSVAFAKLLAAAQENQPQAWTDAEQTLQGLGAAAIPTYLAALKGEDALAREMAVMLLVQLGPPTEEAAEALTPLLEDASSFVRVNAAAALSTLETPPPPAVETLVNLLSHEDENIRVAATTSLGNAGPTALLALPDLARGLADPAAAVRSATAASLGRLGERAERYLAALERLADDEDESVRAAVALAIKQVDPATRSAAGTAIPASATQPAAVDP